MGLGVAGYGLSGYGWQLLGVQVWGGRTMGELDRGGRAKSDWAKGGRVRCGFVRAGQVRGFHDRGCHAVGGRAGLKLTLEVTVVGLYFRQVCIRNSVQETQSRREKGRVRGRVSQVREGQTVTIGGQVQGS